MLDHKHLIISAEVKNLPSDLNVLRKWYVDLVSNIRMKLVSSADLLENSQNPITYNCKVIGNEGVTIAGIIETSHIIIHTWTFENYHKIELDVYSCAYFTVEEVLDHFSVFEPITLQYKFIDRNHGLKEVEL